MGYETTLVVGLRSPHRTTGPAEGNLPVINPIAVIDLAKVDPVVVDAFEQAEAGRDPVAFYGRSGVSIESGGPVRAELVDTGRQVTVHPPDEYVTEDPYGHRPVAVSVREALDAVEKGVELAPNYRRYRAALAMLVGFLADEKRWGPEELVVVRTGH